MGKRGDKPPTFPPLETLRLCVSALKYNRVGVCPRVVPGKWRSLGYEYGVPTKLSTVKALGWSVSGKTFRGWASSAANAAAGKVWKVDGAAVSTAADAGRTLGIYAIWQ